VDPGLARLDANDRSSLPASETREVASTIGSEAGPIDHLRKLLDPARLSALLETGLLDEPADAIFDRFTQLAARLLRVPVALVSLVDDHRQFFKSALGLTEPWATRRETPLSHSFCQYAVTTAEPLIVEDARQHPWLRENLAITDLSVVSYAGMPLVTAEAQVLGALCVIDSTPRAWSGADLETLRELAALTVTEIELRGKVRELKRVEAERDGERQLLRSVLDCMTDSVVVTSRDGKIALTNAAARRSRSPEVMETNQSIARHGVFTSDGVTPLPPEAMPSARALRGEVVEDLELVVRMPGAPEQFASVNSAPIRDASGEIVAAVSVGRDVTAAKRAQNALARSEQLFRNVVGNLPNGAVLVFDHDLRYVMADGERLLSSIAVSKDALVGKTLREAATPRFYDLFETRYRAALAGEKQEFEFVRGSLTYALTIAPLCNSDGVVEAGVVMIYDVTSHKEIEAALRKQTASVELLQAIAAAANSAHDTREAFVACLDSVCAFMDWPIGHAYLKKGDRLAASGFWHDADPARFSAFRERSAELEFSQSLGLIGKVLASGQSAWMPDLTQSSSFLRAEVAETAGLLSGFAFPVLIGNEVVAALEFYSERNDEPDTQLLQLMSNIGTQLGRVVERERAKKELEASAEEIRSLSVHDELTRLYNRRGFMELARQHLKLAERNQAPALLFFVDLNGMKRINDELGHEQGDRALLEMADVLRATLRGSDIVARLGGDEFVAWLPNADEQQLALFSSRIQQELMARNRSGARQYTLSASIGGCAYDPSRPETIEALLVKADALMYQQKKARNTARPSAR